METNEFLSDKKLNKPSVVKLLKKKENLFQKLKDRVNLPPFTDDISVAKEWLLQGKTVVGKKENGKTYIIESPMELKSVGLCSLYTLYIPKKDEYKVVILGGEIFKTYVCKKTTDNMHINYRVRTNPHQWQFVPETPQTKTPFAVVIQAFQAVKGCSLDFGIVNVIWNDFYKKAYVLGVETDLKQLVKPVFYINKSSNNTISLKWQALNDVDNLLNEQFVEQPNFVEQPHEE